jgi:flagellar motor switch protein FliG
MTAVARPMRASSLSGAQKAAVLCMALGADAAAKMLQQLSTSEMELVSREIANLPMVPPEVVDAVLNEFRDVSRTTEASGQGGADYARQVVEAAVGPQRGKAVLEKIREPVVESGLTRLKKATPETLNTLLRGESPQTMALVLAHLDPKLAVGVIATLAPERAAEVLYRMARMEKVSPDVLHLVEAGLGGNADLSLSQEMSSSGGPMAVAQVLNQMTGGADKALLDAIAEKGSDIADQIRNLMFVFEDLLQLDGRSMQRLLRDVDSKELALAIKAASEDLKAHILKNMSERAASALKEEVEMLGAVRVKDVENAHKSIVAVARALQEAGEIVMERAGSDDLIS